MRTVLLHTSMALALAACGGSVNAVPGSGGASSAGGGSAESATASTGGTTVGSGTSSSGAGGAPSFAECDGPGQCILAAPGCCGAGCGMPELGQFVPIHKQHAGDFFNLTCDDPNVGCPECASASNPNLFATCRSGQCLGHDVREHPFSECQVQDDCKLRFGLECCECGSDYLGVTAIRKDAEALLVEAVCVPQQGCDDCVPTTPPSTYAECIAGHCAVVVTPD